MIEGFFSESILNKALRKNLVFIKLWDLRDFTVDKHKTVDDYPYGGGPGMILKPEPIFKAVKEIKKYLPQSRRRKRGQIPELY